MILTKSSFKRRKSAPNVVNKRTKEKLKLMSMSLKMMVMPLIFLDR